MTYQTVTRYYTAPWTAPGTEISKYPYWETLERAVAECDDLNRETGYRLFSVYRAYPWSAISHLFDIVHGPSK